MKKKQYVSPRFYVRKIYDLQTNLMYGGGGISGGSSYSFITTSQGSSSSSGGGNIGGTDDGDSERAKDAFLELWESDF